MIHLLDHHAWHPAALPLLVVGLWASLALAASIYDVGRWISAW